MLLEELVEVMPSFEYDAWMIPINGAYWLTAPRPVFECLRLNSPLGFTP